MALCAAWANAPTRCSRPPTRPCVTIAAVLGGWATSSARHLSCCTTRTTEPHDPQGLITQSHERLLGKSHCVHNAPGREGDDSRQDEPVPGSGDRTSGEMRRL